MIGKERDFILDPEDPAVSALLDERTHSGSAKVQLKYRRKDGSTFIGELSTTLFVDVNGEPRSVAIIRDISERKRAETALKKSESSLAEAQRIAHIGSWEWNIQTGKVNWSAELYSIYGVDPHTFIPTISSFADYVHPDDCEFVNRMINQILSGDKSVNFDFRIVSADGSMHILNTIAEVTDFDENGEPCLMKGINQDITERRRMEAALCENEERFRLALRNSPVVVSMQDTNLVYRWTYNNRTYQPEEVIGKTDADLFAPEDLPAILEAKRRALQNGEVVHHALWLTSNGERVFLDCHYEPLRDSAGSIIGIGIAAVNLTEQKRAEEALRESEERFRVAQELSPDGFLIFRPLRDDTGVVTDFLWIYENDAAAQMNDTNPEEVCGKKVSEVLPHHDQSPFGKAYKEVAETGEVRVVEEAFYDQDTFRQQRWFRVAAVPTTGGDVAILVQNVTERKQAEEALRESEDRYHRLFDSMTEGFLLAELIHDDAGKAADFRILEANLAYESVLGRKREEAIGRTLFEMFPQLSHDRFEAIAAVAQTGKPLRWRGLFEPTGRYYENVYYSPRPGQFAGIFTDITEYKQVDEALRESELKYRTLSNTLEEKVKERTAELEEAYNSLKESEKGLAEAQRISHIGNWDWDIITNKLYLSDEVYRIYGYNPQEFDVTYDLFLIYLHPDDRDYVDNAFKKASTENPISIDYRIILANGEERVSSCTG